MQEFDKRREFVWCSGIDPILEIRTANARERLWQDERLPFLTVGVEKTSSACETTLATPNSEQIGRQGATERVRRAIIAIIAVDFRRLDLLPLRLLYADVQCSLGRVYYKIVEWGRFRTFVVVRASLLRSTRVIRSLHSAEVGRHNYLAKGVIHGTTLV